VGSGIGDSHGEKDAVLVDTLLTVEQATALVEWVAAHGKNVTTIYVTHGHGDHFFGLGAVLDGVWRDCRCRGVSSYLSISMGSLVWRCHFSFTHSARKQPDTSRPEAIC
jgi:ribonuclease BN (tRNA processing enzyme)